MKFHYLEVLTCIAYCVLFILQTPKVVEGFGYREVIKVAACPEGSHYLALTNDGKVFSWGFGDGGRLGHGDNM